MACPGLEFPEDIVLAQVLVVTVVQIVVPIEFRSIGEGCPVLPPNCTTKLATPA